jgi:peptidase E
MEFNPTHPLAKDLKLAIQAHLEENGASDSSPINIVCILDADEKNQFKELQRTVKQLVEDLGYRTNMTEHKLKVLNRKGQKSIMEYLDEIGEKGAIAVVPGGNTWRLAEAFKEIPHSTEYFRKKVKDGKLMYVSFSAGSILSGPTVENNQDPLPPGVSKTKKSLSLQPDVVRPHANIKRKREKEEEFQRRMEAGRITDDSGKTLRAETVYIKDGEAYKYWKGKRTKLGNA